MALDPLDPIVRPILRVLSMMAINTNYGFIIYTQVRMTKLLVINRSLVGKLRVCNLEHYPTYEKTMDL